MAHKKVEDVIYPEDIILLVDIFMTRKPRLQCHFCREELHENNNAMTRCMDGKPPAAKGFGWVSVIVHPFREVPCCDFCFDTEEVQNKILMA